MSRHHIEVRDEPVEDPPALEEHTAVLAPGTHPRRGSGWFLFYLDRDGRRRTYHIPHPWAHDIHQAQIMARRHLRDLTAERWL
ncbi:hypothetical protein ACWKWC_01270 [Geodermatophilus nigrescens]